MIPRYLSAELSRALNDAPAACVLGPRQVGKTTLALDVGRKRDALYLDLESEADRAKLADATLYLSAHSERLVILDEIHRMPGIFPVLRGLIDRGRRAGIPPGRYLLLGSASVDLLRQAGESLAGRIRYLELTPFSLSEPTGMPVEMQWLRGGFPDSLLARSDAASMRWRRDFIRSYLERDIVQFAPRLAAETLRRFWIMLAHRQGAPLNSAELARSLGVDAKTVARYLDLLVDLFLVRRLQPWHANVGKRLLRSPRVFLRDSGMLHALLALQDMDALLTHPVVGASWEGFVMENLLAVAPEGAQCWYYRTSGGAEIDLLLSFPDSTLWAIEIKRSLAPKVDRGFHEACVDLNPAYRCVVYPGNDRYPVSDGIEVLPLLDLVSLVRREEGQRISGETRSEMRLD
jgi:uncharacterized protein